MEEIGRFIVRYYIRISGIFSKSNRILHIHEQGITFTSTVSPKLAKEKENYLFKDIGEIIISDRNDKDFILKIGKQSLSITCSDRLNILTDLDYYKVIWVLIY